MSGTDSAPRTWPLRTMIFALTGALLVLAVAFAIGLTWLQGQRLADEAVDAALARSRTAQTDFRNLRFRELELMAELVGDEPYFANLIANATGGGLFGRSEVDVGSITDQLLELRDRVGFDFGMVLGPSGELLAHSERPVAAAEDLMDHPLVAPMVDELLPVTGFWYEGSALYQVAMTPMEKDANLIGFVAVGLRVGDRLLEEIKRVSGTELIWLAEGRPVASTLPTAETGWVLDDLGGVAGDQAPLTEGREEIRLDNSRWIASVAPISATAAVTSISLTSLDRVLAAYRNMLSILLLGGAITVVLALLLSFALSRRVTRPLTRLATAADEAAGGSYDASFSGISGSTEVARMAGAFDSLLSELREKQDMEEYVADLSRYLPDPGTEEARVRPDRELATSRGECVLLALEYRDGAGSDAASEADLVSEFEENARWMSTLAHSHNAELEWFEGQRALFAFDGADDFANAMACLGAASQGSRRGFGAAISSGPVARTTVRSDGRNHRVLLGKAVLQADLLVEESRSGLVLFAPALKKQLSSWLEEHDLAVTTATGRLSGRKYYGLNHERLRYLPAAAAEEDVDATRAQPVNLASTARSIAPGDVFAGRYEIVSVLGRGGMGMVYKAYDRELEDFVALKTLLPEIASNSDYLAQLKEEIKLARRITHPNVLRTYDFGSFDGVPFISMEYVRGMTLRYLLEQRERLPFSAGLRIARQLCAGLAAAHEQNVIHRDIKPENLILEAAGNAKLMDFGIASPMQHLKEGSRGVFVGTPRYAAPEQMEGEAVDARADVFACGVMFYELFTGARPFTGSVMDIYKTKTAENYPAPDSMDSPVPQRLSSIILRCMRRTPGDRYEDAAELGRALREIRA